MPRSFPYGALPLFGGIAIITLSSIILFVLFTNQLQPISNDRQPTYETNNPLITKVGEADTLSQPSITTHDPIHGKQDAPVTLTVFSDFSCPYCKVLSQQLISTVNQNENTKLVWKDFPITTVHPESGNAHIAAQCASTQGKFWEYHNLLFMKQQDFSRQTLQEYARQLNLNQLDFSRCLDSEAPIENITADISEGQSLGIDGTPYLFINDQRVSGLVTQTEMEQLIELHTRLTE